MDLIALATLWLSFGSFSSTLAILANGFFTVVFHSGQSFFRWPIFWHLKHRPSFLSLSFLVDHVLAFPGEAASISIGTTSFCFFFRTLWKLLIHLLCLVWPKASPFFRRDSLITRNRHTSWRPASSHSSMVIGQVSRLRMVARIPYFSPSLNFSMAPTSDRGISPLLRRFSKQEM